MTTLEKSWQRFVEFLQERQTTLASGLAALLIIVVGFLIFNFFLNVNKEEVDQETTQTATEEAELADIEITATPTTTTTPTATPTPTPKKESGLVSQEGAATTTASQTYTVAKGDTLGTIAKKVYNDSSKWSLIRDANRITNPNVIHVGNKLMIPKVDSPAVVASKPDTTTQAGNVEYIVTRGDTLWQIADDFYGSGFEWYRIKNANPDKIKTSSTGKPLIEPGQHLIIP